MSHIWSKEYDDKLRQRIAELDARTDDTLAKLLERERLNIILQKKNEELEAERDAWHKMWEEQGSINDRNSKHWKRQYNDLIAERDRYKEALQEITEQGRTGEDADVMAELAQEALRETTEEINKYGSLDGLLKEETT